MTVAASLGVALGSHSWGLAVAESLTGGALASAIVDSVGASSWFRGGVVSYDTRVKRRLLGVDADLLDEHGAVHPEVARQMAERVRAVVSTDDGPADVGIGTTGVAGPDPQDGQPVGTVFIGVATPERTVVREFAFDGDRAAIRAATVTAALELALELID